MKECANARRRSKQEERFRRALAMVVVAVVALCVAIAPGAWATSSPVGAAGSYVDGIWERVSTGTGFEDAMRQVGFRCVDVDDAPDWLEEICSPRLLAGGYANDDYTLIGLSRSGSAEEMASAMRCDLVARGWVEHDSGYEGVTTYMKDKGRCRWIMVEVSEADGTSSAVLHIGLT